MADIPVTERVRKLREESVSAQPRVCMERARIENERDRKPFAAEPEKEEWEWMARLNRRRKS